jgi:hypothetical protein
MYGLHIGARERRIGFYGNLTMRSKKQAHSRTLVRLFIDVSRHELYSVC